MTIDLSDADIYREKQFYCEPADLPKLVMELFAADAYELTITPLMDAHLGEEGAFTDEFISEYMIVAMFGEEEKQDDEATPVVTEKEGESNG